MPRFPVSIVVLLASACAAPPVAGTPREATTAPPAKGSTSVMAAAPTTAVSTSTSSSSALPSAPPSPIPSPLDIGCFALSTKDRGAACVVGDSSIQAGGKYALVFLGANGARFPVGAWGTQDFKEHPLKVAPGDVANVEARLRDKDYRALPADVVEVMVGATVTAGAAKLRLTRKKVKSVALVDGAWEVVKDTLSAQCAPKPTWTTIEEQTIEGPTASTARVRTIDEHTLLIERSTTFGIEGDGGGTTAAVVLETDTCKVFRAE